MSDPNFDQRDLVWLLDLRHYSRWTPQEREDVHAFVERHGIDHTRVPTNNGNTLEVHAVDEQLVLRTWIHLRTDNGVPRCPSCPSCVKCEQVQRPLAGELPNLESAYLAVALMDHPLRSQIIAALPSVTFAVDFGHVGEQGPELRDLAAGTTVHPQPEATDG